MTIVAISGHFDPFHDMHLDYIKQALCHGDHLICIVSSDNQLLMKKNKVNIPEQGRLEIVDLVLKGLNVVHETVLNIYDTDTTLITKVLEVLKPDVLCRGGDKSLENMPIDEQKVCRALGIKVVYAEFRANRHGADIVL